MMGEPKFAIPEEFASQLEYAKNADTRSDTEILKSLGQHHPVTSEKNIWAFWHAGLDAMPTWCQRNVAAWVRICGPSWTVRVLDNLPESPNYALRFISTDLVPDCFRDRTMDGPYIGPHSADFLRGATLYLYGGAYMDVGNMLFRSLDRVCWKQLEDPASPYQICVPFMYGSYFANHFIAARKADPFIKRWHEIFCSLWEGKVSSVGIIDNPLVAFGKELNYEDSRALKYDWDFNVEPQVMFEYISQILAWSRLCVLEQEPPLADGTPGFNPNEYWQKKVLKFDVLTEDWGGEELIGFAGSGDRFLELFSTKLDGDADSERYKTARQLVWKLLTKSTMQKITHGKGLTKSVHLGTLWDLPENEDKDCAPGTFAELMRYGAVHYVQTRPSVNYVEAPAAPKLLKKGYLEP